MTAPFFHGLNQLKHSLKVRPRCKTGNEELGLVDEGLILDQEVT
jgi:hypothetical protein